MEKKKCIKQQITYVEILTYAIRHIEEQIQRLYDESKDAPEGSLLYNMTAAMAEPLREKRALMKILYLMETGTEYE